MGIGQKSGWINPKVRFLRERRLIQPAQTARCPACDRYRVNRSTEGSGSRPNCALCGLDLLKNGDRAFEQHSVQLFAMCSVAHFDDTLHLHT